MPKNENAVTASRRLRAGAGAAVLVATGTCLVYCADQPKPYCITSTTSYAVKLIERSRVESVPGACSSFGPASFNADPEAGFASYFERDDKGQPNYSKGSLAVQTAELGTLLQTAQGAGADNMATDGKVYSMGPYSSAQTDNAGFCTVPTLAPTHLVLPALPPSADMTFAGQPAIDITLTWSNVQVYVTAGTIGTQIQADLVDKRLTPTGDSCTITYKAVALAPAVSCACTAGNPMCATPGADAGGDDGGGETGSGPATDGAPDGEAGAEASAEAGSEAGSDAAADARALADGAAADGGPSTDAMTDAMSDATPEAMADAVAPPTTGGGAAALAVDPTLCDPNPNPAIGRFLGSGIGPATNYTCDTTLGWCTIKGDTIPALR